MTTNRVIEEILILFTYLISLDFCVFCALKHIFAFIAGVNTYQIITYTDYTEI